MELNSIMRVDLLEKELTRLLSWISSVETRIRLVLPLSMAMLGVLAVLTPAYSSWAILPAIMSAFSVLFLMLSVACAALASFPRTLGPKGSIIYFGGIASMELEQYRDAVKKLTTEEYLEDLIKQCHRNAQIAERKFVWIQRALGCVFLATTPWAISVYLLYSVKS